MLDNSIALYQDGGTDQFNSESKFGIVVINVSGQDTKEASNITSQTWNGEDGEDVLLPTETKFKAYDVNFTLGVKDSILKKAREIKNDFINYIKTKMWMIYQPYTDLYLSGCVYSKSEEDEVGKDFLTFKLTLKVTKPSSMFKVTQTVAYSNLTATLEYPDVVIPISGGTLNVKSLVYSQKKTTTYDSAGTDVETITQGASVRYAISGGGTTSNVGVRNGILTIGANTSTQRTIQVTATITLNGQTTTATANITQQGVPDRKPYYVGLVNGTADSFARLTTQQLFNNAFPTTDSAFTIEAEMWIVYMILPVDYVSFSSIEYTDGNINSVVDSISDLNVSHLGFTKDGIAYNVYGLRTSPSNLQYTFNVVYK